MKVAVISDIHANMQALEAVIADITNQKCEQIFCLGDIVLAGPEPKEVIEYVMKQTSWVTIQGNTDKMIAQYGPEIDNFLKEQYPIMANAIADDVKILDDSHRAYLDNLPPMLPQEIEGVKVLLTHGSPRANNEDISAGRSIEEIEEIIKDSKEDLILCGHTHIPCAYQTNTKQTVVNVGSIGRPMTEEPEACYIIINFQQGTFEITHRFIKYDNKKAAEIMSKRNFIGADRLSDLLLNPVERHI